MRVLSLFKKSSKVPRKELEEKVRTIEEERAFARETIIQVSLAAPVKICLCRSEFFQQLEKHSVELQKSLDELQDVKEMCDARERKLMNDLEGPVSQRPWLCLVWNRRKTF